MTVATFFLSPAQRVPVLIQEIEEFDDNELRNVILEAGYAEEVNHDVHVILADHQLANLIVGLQVLEEPGIFWIEQA